MEMVCTPCGHAVEPNTSVIVGIEQEGKLFFRWACEHHPVGDAAVVLGSSMCAAVFVSDHPEYADAIDRLLAAREC